MERMIKMLAKIQVMVLVSTVVVSAIKTATMIKVDRKIHEAMISVPRIKKNERSEARFLEKRP